MQRINLAVSALIVSALAIVPGVHAQARLGIAAGLAVPAGDFGDFAKSGFNVEGSVEFRSIGMPFGIRGDVFFNRFDFDDDAMGGGGNFRALGASLNAILQLSGVGAAPYLLGGPTITNMDASLDNGIVDLDSETDIGLQGGIGVKFPLTGFTSKVEARFSHVFNENEDLGFPNSQWFTVNFGVLFGGM